VEWVRVGVSEPLALHRRADRAVHRCAQAQVALHALAANVDEAILQAGVLGHLVGALVHGERWRLGDVEDLDHAVLQLDATRGQTVIDVLRRACGDRARDAHDVFAAHVDRVVDHSLGDAGVVADVEEGQLLAVLAAGGDPPGERGLLADVLGAQLAALMGTHGCGTHVRAF